LCRTASSVNHTDLIDLYDIGMQIKDKLFYIVSKYCPAPPRYQHVTVPFNDDSLTIRFRNPVKIPFLVYINTVESTYNNVVEIYLGRNLEVNSIFIDFWYGALRKVELEINNMFKSDESFMLAYLMFPEIYNAIKESDIETDYGYAKKWLDELLTYSSMNESNFIDPIDLFDSNRHTKLFRVFITDFSEHVESIQFELSIARDSNDFSRITTLRLDAEINIRNKGKVKIIHGNSRYTSTENLMIKVDTESNTKVKDVANKAIETLFELANSDHIFNEIKSAVTTFLNAYRKIVFAVKFMNI